jgi:hypothetical protein
MKTFQKKKIGNSQDNSRRKSETCRTWAVIDARTTSVQLVHNLKTY